MDEIELTNTKEQPTVTIREKVKVGEIPQTMGRMFGDIYGTLMGKAQLTGPAFVYYHSWSNDEVDMECGFYVVGDFKPFGKFRAFTLPAVKAVVATHVGPYDKLVDSYTKMQEWMKNKGLVPAEQMWELYLNGPDEVPPEKLITKMVWPVK
jgi:AraC family transcriptional regulator